MKSQCVKTHKRPTTGAKAHPINKRWKLVDTSPKKKVAIQVSLSKEPRIDRCRIKKAKKKNTANIDSAAIPAHHALAKPVEIVAKRAVEAITQANTKASTAPSCHDGSATQRAAPIPTTATAARRVRREN